MDTRTERIVVETDRQRIVGDITLPREGYRSRLSDFLNQGEVTFLALADARITPIDANGEVEPEERAFIAVARRHVLLAYPLEPGRDEL